MMRPLLYVKPAPNPLFVLCSEWVSGSSERVNEWVSGVSWWCCTWCSRDIVLEDKRWSLKRHQRSSSLGAISLYLRTGRKGGGGWKERPLRGHQPTGSMRSRRVYSEMGIEGANAARIAKPPKLYIRKYIHRLPNFICVNAHVTANSTYRGRESQCYKASYETSWIIQYVRQREGFRICSHTCIKHAGPKLKDVSRSNWMVIICAYN